VQLFKSKRATNTASVDTVVKRKKEWFINQVRQCCCHYDVLTL